MFTVRWSVKPHFNALVNKVKVTFNVDVVIKQLLSF